MKKFWDWVSGWKLIVTAVAATLALISPFAIKIDNRWANAESTLNSIQEVYQHSQKTSQRLDIKIAEDKLDTARNNKIQFEIKYGLDVTKYSEAEEQLYIMIIKDWEKAVIGYELAIDPPVIVIE